MKDFFDSIYQLPGAERQTQYAER